ncbi:MAG: DNA gyrase subunit A [Parcubacteria group bacterium]
MRGQGNFGCFTKDTRVKLADGRNLSFEDLIKEDKQGKKNYTYTVNSLGLISIAQIKKPRLTIENAEVIRVVLDNGQKIKCTPNHLFMLKNGQYEEAQNLKKEDSLMPLYEKLSEKTDRLNREGYTLVYQPKKDEWVPVHHLADNFNLTVGKYIKSVGRVRHHSDFNKLNNSPENIVRMNWKEHWSVHYENASLLHKSANYRQKIKEGRDKYWSDSQVREQYAKRLSERNVINWENPEYREKMRLFLSEMNKQYMKDHPEKRQEISERATKTLKRLWKNPEYRAIMHERIIKGNKNHKTNKTGRLKFLNVCKEIIAKNLEINEKNYSQFRKKVYAYGAATLWETGLNKYFQNSPDLIRQEISKNHRIVRIEKIKEKEDVFDLTIDNSHNFCLGAGVFVHNSMDGDSAAAYRYTEAKLSVIAEEMLIDIEKNTVDFVPNFDGQHKEPTVLPAGLPQLLLNGSMGIAVGMATNIPPHNLGELIDGINCLIENPDAEISDLAEFVKGPDFPTGGIIYNKKDILEAYKTGRGKILTRAKAEIVETKAGAFQIIVSEMTYATNKATMIERMADLVHEGKIVGIRDIRDESDKEGVRLVIELKKDAYPQKVLNKLYSLTDLQKNFGVNMLALVGGIEPQILNLKDILEEYIEHRKIVITRRTKYDLEKARDRAHILEGLKIALDHIDAVIETIKKSETKEIAHVNLMKKFKLSDRQATAILEMRLQTLAGLEQKKIEDELAEKLKLIAELEAILKSEKKILGIVKDELARVKEKYGDERKTKIVKGGITEFKQEDLVPNDEAIITISKEGYIKRMDPAVYKVQRRGGKGVIGATTKEGDEISEMLGVMAHDNLLFFTNTGKVFQTKAYEIPASTRIAKGQSIVNFLSLSSEEKITALVASGKDDAYKYMFMATENGTVKKTSIEEFENVRRSGLIAIKLEKGDALSWAEATSGSDEVVITTQKGQAIRFRESDVRPMGRAAAGVRGIKLKTEDKVVGMDVVFKGQKGNQLLVIGENGYGKRSDLKSYKVQKRGGSGIKTASITAKTGKLIGAQVVNLDDIEQDLIMTSEKGQIIRIELKTVSVLGRATQGVRVMRPQPGDKVSAITVL